MDAVTALPSLARGMLDGVTRHIGLILGKRPPFVYPPSSVPTRNEETLTEAKIQNIQSWCKFCQVGDIILDH